MFVRTEDIATEIGRKPEILTDFGHNVGTPTKIG